MQKIWGWIMVSAIMYALLSRRPGAADAFLGAGEAAVSLSMSMLATMTLWGGLLEILSRTGDVKRMWCGLKRMLRKLFGDMEDDCWEAVSMNLSANLLGLGNAATPSGVRASQLLAVRGQEGLRALAMLLTLNNAGLQLFPTTVMTLRKAAGSTDPGCIWLPSLAAAASSALVGVLTLLLLQGRQRR